MIGDLFSILLLIVAALNLFLLFFIASEWRSAAHRAYGSTVIGVILWILSIFFFRILVDLQWAAFAWGMSYMSALIIAVSFLIFSFVFPEEGHTVFPTSAVLLVAAPFFFFFFLTIAGSTHFLSPLFVRAIVTPLGAEKYIILGPLHALYGFYFGGCMAWAFVNLIKKYKTATAFVRVQLKFVLGGTLIATLLGFFFNYLLFYIGDSTWARLGPVFSIIMTSCIGYAIFKHHLMNVRVIATEILSTIILGVLLVEFFLSRTPFEYILRGVFFSIVCVLSYLLMKSVLREVEQREKLQVLSDQLAVANKELFRLDQAKSEFLSIASHQLRAPLTAIKGYSSMLLEGTFGSVEGKVKEGIDKVFQSTERMVGLVNDLLDTSRLDSGRMVFNFVETDLGETAKSVCDELVPKAKEKGLAVTCTVAQKLAKVFVDQMKIRQVLVNFVDNALKYSDTGTVEVRLEQKGDEVLFSVHDNGWGMTPEEMGFLFKKFSRGRGETSHIKGTGLGLYVARRLAEAHGGRVWAESEGKGKGSTFFLALKVGWKPSADGVYQPKEE